MDKRGRQRRKTHITVRFGPERAEKLGIITDVSSDGLHISTNAVLPPGSTLHLQVQLSDGELMSLQGRVMRAMRVPQSFVTVMRGGMGVRLTNPPADWRERLLPSLAP
jgi:hypothetical protein